MNVIGRKRYHGQRDAVAPTGPDLPKKPKSKSEFKAMDKDDLIALAASSEIELDEDPNKADVVDALKEHADEEYAQALYDMAEGRGCDVDEETSVSELIDLIEESYEED